MFGGCIGGGTAGDGGCLHRTCLLCLFQVYSSSVRCIGEKGHLKIEALLSAGNYCDQLQWSFNYMTKEKLLCRVASAEVGEDKRW